MHCGVNGRTWILLQRVVPFAMLTLALLAGCSQSNPLRPPGGALPAAIAGTNVRVWTDRLTLPTHDVGSDPIPHFPLTERDKFYPYPAQRDIAGQAHPRAWTVLCMENEYLRIQVMPELGGRVFSIYDKLAGQEMVYRQASIKPVAVGIRGAWVAGGIEFNFPDCHTVTTHDNVHWTIRQNSDGSVSILIGDVERISRMGWTVELRLSPGCACLDDRVSLINRTAIRQRCFYWTNAAVEGTDQVQMILPAPKVILGTRNRPLDWPLRGGADFSWLRAYDGGTSILGVGGDEDFVAAYDHARQVGLVHYADRDALPARKFWTWGIGGSGDYWARRVSDDDKPYLEMQAGPRVTLSETAWMQPFETVRFEECWIPVSRIGPVARANPDAAVRLTVEPTAPAPGAVSGATGSSACQCLFCCPSALAPRPSPLVPPDSALRTQHSGLPLLPGHPRRAGHPADPRRPGRTPQPPRRPLAGPRRPGAGPADAADRSHRCR